MALCVLWLIVLTHKFFYLQLHSMNKIRCLIVDDEPPALNLLESYVIKTPFLELSGKCNDAFKALEIIDKQPIDLLFLDIQMPDLSGIELSRALGPGIRVIFTTAFEQYAIDGFRVDALDYLLKPFNYEEFLRSARKARQRINNDPPKSAGEAGESMFFVRSAYTQVKIDLNKVMYFESLKDYIKIHVVGNDPPILSLMSLKLLETRLPHNKFLRIHRSYIVNIEYIKAIERNQVIIGNERITVADQYVDAFHNFVAKHTFRP